MKTYSLMLAAILSATGFVKSQDALIADSTEPVVAPTIARIVGKIPDGTPPPPAPPKPEFIVPQKDILSTTTQEQDGRTITIQRIKPIDLPPPDSGARVPPSAPSEEFKQRISAYRAAHPRVEPVCLGATVYRSKNYPPRTLLRYWPDRDGDPITLWSSADFSLISGIHSFVGTDGKSRGLMMTWSYIDTDRMATRAASGASPFQAPIIPGFPTGNATFQIVGNQPTAEQLIPIQSLHDLYNTEHERLLAAYQGREQARIQREAELKANPPVPQDITITYWRTESPAPAKGGAK